MTYEEHIAAVAIEHRYYLKRVLISIESNYLIFSPFVHNLKFYSVK